MDITVRPAFDSELPTVAALLSEAFATDPAAHRIVGVRPREQTRTALEDLLEPLIRLYYFPDGEVDVAVAADGEVVGAALWDRPGSSLGLRAQLAMAPSVVGVLGRRLAKTAIQSFRVQAYHPKFPHWYLFMIGARPEAQGAGVGSALLRHGLDRAGDEAAYLEASTPESAALYQRMGFVPLGLTPLPADDDDPELAMWRPGAMPT
ncbi:Mycothiol acetyltransferase [Corynebacterium atrinae]|uniref:GNAT family N-acetyltransferase n=1 Tax=Corynebacterium atrinae TaxID=1336740 RepID=UPI0025B34E86|nr:GNAT family N-acetyltransferase [Corynebacterium atrinae]WJY62181.1 Mycothiol acetyltransferase [Corynebacterium atrinae]